MHTFVSGKFDSGFGSDHPGAGKKSGDKKKADQAKKAEKGKKKKKAKGGDQSAKLFKQAAGLLNEAAKRLGGGAGQSNPFGQLGGANPLDALGALGGLGLGGGYNPLQGMGINQGLSNGWNQIAGAGGTNITNINYNFGGGGGFDSNPFAQNFAGSFGAPCPTPMPGPQPQNHGFSGAMAFSFA